jgi:hypothetical protein
MDALEKMVFLLKAVPDYEAGASINALSDKYGVPSTTIQNLFKQHNVKTRRVGRPRATRQDSD